MDKIEYMKKLVEDSDITRVMFMKILDDNNNLMDAKDLMKEFDKRIELIKKELSLDSGESVFDFCPLCSGQLGSKLVCVRRVHDIVFHYKYYVEQTNGSR